MPVKVSYAYCDWSDVEDIRKQISKCKPEEGSSEVKEKENVKRKLK